MRAQDLANALCHHAVALALRMTEFWDEHCWQYERACRDWEAHARARDEYWEEHVRTLEADMEAEYQADCAPLMKQLRLRHFGGGRVGATAYDVVGAAQGAGLLMFRPQLRGEPCAYMLADGMPFASREGRRFSL